MEEEDLQQAAEGLAWTLWLVVMLGQEGLAAYDALITFILYLYGWASASILSI